MKRIFINAYEAEDGKVFTTKAECRDYEASSGTAEFYDHNGKRYHILKQNPINFDIRGSDYGNCHAVHITSSHCTIKNNSKFETWEKGWYFFSHRYNDWFKVPEPYDAWIQP